MTLGNGWRLAKVSLEQRVAVREALLRGAARNYAENVDTREEVPAAEKLREAAIEYAATLLQHTGRETSALSRASGRKRRKDGKKEDPR